MTYCPFCGGKLDRSGKCPDCGQDYGNKPQFNTEQAPHCDVCGINNTDDEKNSLPVWFKIIAVFLMLVISSGALIGLIVGAVLSTSKNPMYSTYGKCILKLAVIVIIIKVAIMAVVWLTVGFGSIFLMFNSI